MRTYTALFLAVVLFSFPLLSSSQETKESRAKTIDNGQAIQVIVTANKVETPIEEVGSSVSVITAKEIQEKQSQSVGDALRNVPSVDIVQSGGTGGDVAAFIRGSNPEHTLVLIDGIEANNPITPNRTFNFADLSTDNIDRIEVLKGPQSTLYGSDAMGGVINIITKKGEQGMHAFGSAEAGSYATFIERAGLSGANQSTDYSFAVSREDVGGISAADKKFGNSERDAHQNTTLSTKVGAQLMDELRAQATVRYFAARNGLDDCGGTGCDDPNRVLHDDRFFGRAELQASLFDNRLKQTLAYSATEQSFDDNNDPDPTHPLDLLRSKYISNLSKIEFQNHYKVNDNLSLLGGYDSQDEHGRSSYFSDSAFGSFGGDFSKRSSSTNSYYMQAQTSLSEKFFSAQGLRLDDHSKFGTKLTWRVAPALLFEESGTKFSGSVGTAFKAPSLFQLYSIYGREDLKAEKNLGWDLGIEQKFFDKKLKVGTTFFSNHFDDLISFNPNTFVSENIASAKTRGLENFLELKPVEWATTRLSYTYTYTKDETLDEPLLRRPKDKVAADFDFAVTQDLHLHLAWFIVGKRYDNNYETFPATRIKLPGYELVNIAASYSLSPRIQLFARVDNVFDRSYEQVYGYGTMGAAAYGGIKVNL